jgi:hypothetical protein
VDDDVDLIRRVAAELGQKRADARGIGLRVV